MPLAWISRKVVIAGWTAVLRIFPTYFFQEPTAEHSHLKSKHLFDKYINDDRPKQWKIKIFQKSEKPLFYLKIYLDSLQWS